jgi:hypothetical protein
MCYEIGQLHVLPTLCADCVEKVRKSNSRETISRASITVSKDDSRYRLSVNHCFAPAAIAAAEQTFSNQYPPQAAIERSGDLNGGEVV